MSEPIRTCVACRTRELSSSLVRIVSVAGIATVDQAKKLPGRGAHLHSGPDCLTTALKRRAIQRALRTDVDCSALAKAPDFFDVTTN
ncbi:MAG: YlxR family protein [Propionibacteriaceae bacterium]